MKVPVGYFKRKKDLLYLKPKLCENIDKLNSLFPKSKIKNGMAVIKIKKGYDIKNIFNKITIVHPLYVKNKFKEVQKIVFYSNFIRIESTFKTNKKVVFQLIWEILSLFKNKMYVMTGNNKKSDFPENFEEFKKYLEPKEVFDDEYGDWICIDGSIKMIYDQQHVTIDAKNKKNFEKILKRITKV